VLDFTRLDVMIIGGLAALILIGLLALWIVDEEK
jgi:hypothetical protein